MKKILLLGLVLVLFVTLTACSSPQQYMKTKTLKEDVNIYLVSLNKLNKELEDEGKIYEKRFVPEKDENKALAILETSLIPQQEEIVKEAKDVKLQTQDLKQVHAIFIKANEMQLDTYKKYEKSLKTQNNDVFNEANNQLKPTADLYKEHKTAFLELVKKNNIKVIVQ